MTNLSYESKEKLEKLSKRLASMQEENSYVNHTDERINVENIQYGLSLLISKIILAIEFQYPTESDLLDVIRQYNESSGAALNLEHYKNLSWIRYVNGEIKLPRVVSRYLRRIERDQEEGKSIEIPADKNHLVLCLLRFQQKYANHEKVIFKAKLKSLIAESCNIKISLDYLEQEKIIESSSEENKYRFTAHDHIRFLGNEIASLLWYAICQESANLHNFKEYIRVLQYFGIWPNAIIDFLLYSDRQKMCELSIEFLLNEEDIVASALEFQKVWLDSPSYSHIEFNHNVPKLNIASSTSYELIKSIEFHQWRFRESFDHQKTRMLYILVLRLILQIEGTGNSNYGSTLLILNNPSYPFLVWSLYGEIEDRYNKVIPCLLQKLELAPLAFKLIYGLKISQHFTNALGRTGEQVKELAALRSEIWLVTFDALLDQLSSSSVDKEEAGVPLASILADIAFEVFKNKNSAGQIEHEASKGLYALTLEKLLQKRISVDNIYPIPKVKPRLFPLVLNTLFSHLKLLSAEVNHTKSLYFEAHIFDLLVELLHFCNSTMIEGEVTDNGINELANLREEIALYLFTILSNYLTKGAVKVQDYELGKVVEVEAKFRGQSFGVEIINWAYLFQHLYYYQKLWTLDEILQDSIVIESTSEEGKYSDRNREQEEKIKFYLQILMYAYIGLAKQKVQLEIEGFDTKGASDAIEDRIKNYALKYSKENPLSQQLDVFDEWLISFENNMYYQSLTTLLYRCVNLFSLTDQQSFVKEYFQESIELGRMLTAINLLESRQTKDIIALQIEAIDVENFIDSKFTVSEVETALIEAINSDTHWEKFTHPLLNRIERHYNRNRHEYHEKQDLLFQVKLLLAFKKKDSTLISEVEEPKSDYARTENLNRWSRHKRYYMALSALYNESKTQEAISELESLLTHDEKNVFIAFHLYKARIQSALESKELQALIKAKKEWDGFVEQLGKEEKEKLDSLEESLNFISLQYYAARKDYVLFDKVAHILTNRYRYDVDVIPIVFNLYTERKLHEVAFEYIKHAVAYLESERINIPASVKAISDSSESENLLVNLRASFSSIRSLSPKSLIKIVPEVLNDKRKLSDFILHELLLASRVMLDKIHSVSDVHYEDKYNDLLLAILRLRFPIWGWNIQDQSRAGTSPTGKGPGEVDFFIQSAGSNIALIEALNLKGGNFSVLEKHVLKCDSYCTYVGRFYILTYYQGKGEDFDSMWRTYEQDILRIPYPPRIKIDLAAGLVDLTDKFEDSRGIKIARSYHENNLEFFHIMLDLSLP